MEKKVKDTLSKHRIESYWPLTSANEIGSRRNILLSKPVFDRFIFVCLSQSEKPVIQRVEGVQGFVYWLGSPVIITAEEIDLIRNFTGNYEDVRIEKIQVTAHDRIPATYKQLFYEVNELDGEKINFVKVLLPTIGYALFSKLKRSKVEVLNISKRGAESKFPKFISVTSTQ